MMSVVCKDYNTRLKFKFLSDVHCFCSVETLLFDFFCFCYDSLLMITCFSVDWPKGYYSFFICCGMLHQIFFMDRWSVVSGAGVRCSGRDVCS